MTRPLHNIILLVLIALFAAGCKAPDKESVAYRAELYEGCAQCHGADGLGKLPPVPEDPAGLGVPAIAGLDSWYVNAQLRKFRRGQRGWHEQDLGGKRMEPMARVLASDEDVNRMAEYVASLPAKRPEPILAGGNPEAGKILFAPCQTCHGENAQGVLDQRGPALNHASDWYLYKQLRNFKAGVRGKHPEDVTGAKMQPFAMTLANEQAMKDVIAYIMTLRGPDETAN